MSVLSFELKKVGEKGVRRGALRVRGSTTCVETPAFVSPSVKGYVAHTTPLLTRDEPCVLGVSMPDLVDDAALIKATSSQPGCKKGCVWGPGSATARDGAILYGFMGDLTQMKSSTISAKHLVTVSCKRGNELVPVERLIELATSPCIGIHLFESPCIESSHDESSSRHNKCEVATCAILDKALAAVSASKASDGAKVDVVACVLGGTTEKQRKAAAEHVAARKEVAGYSFCEFGIGENQIEREVALRAALPYLDETKLRVIKRISAPSDVVKLIVDGTVGMDLFVTDWPEKLALEGYALCFPVSPPPDSTSGSSTTIKPVKFSLDDTALMEDHGVLLPSCQCHACRNEYTRAYIHHLRNTHEMLSDILLTQHNRYHFAAFFEAIRAAIDGGTITSFAEYYCSNF